MNKIIQPNEVEESEISSGDAGVLGGGSVFDKIRERIYSPEATTIKSLGLEETAYSDNSIEFASIEEQIGKQKVLDKETDRELRRMYAKWMLGILIGQLLLMNLIFALAGWGTLKFTETTLEIYMGGTLAEVFAIVAIVSKYLFPNNKSTK